MPRKNLVSCSGISASILPVSVIKSSGGLPSPLTVNSSQRSATHGHPSDPVWSVTKAPVKYGTCTRRKKPDPVFIYLKRFSQDSGIDQKVNGLIDFSDLPFTFSYNHLVLSNN